MLILILVLLLIAFTLCLVLRKKLSCTTIPYTSSAILPKFFNMVTLVLGFAIILLLLPIGNLSLKIATNSTIDRKIEIYEEENAKIEKDIDAMIKQYLEKEYNLSVDLKRDDNPIALTTLFSELKSDDFVKHQRAQYIDNQKKIMQLKEEKIDVTKLKWLLYFGK